MSAKSMGTGFIINDRGDVLTNHHVVSSADDVFAVVEGHRTELTLVASDETNDLALLQMGAPSPSMALFRVNRQVRTGENIVVVGYPHGGSLSTEPTVTTGIVSAPTGPSDDTRMVQITASVHAGNSGGPLLDSSANVIGIVNAKLDAVRFWAATGDIPQNINFAITENVVLGFLDAHDIPYELSPSHDVLSTIDIAAEARGFTVLIECHGDSNKYAGGDKEIERSGGVSADRRKRREQSGAANFIKGVFWLIVIVIALSFMPTCD